MKTAEFLKIFLKSLSTLNVNSQNNVVPFPQFIPNLLFGNPQYPLTQTFIREKSQGTYQDDLEHHFPSKISPRHVSTKWLFSPPSLLTRE
ncbi:hypothetical protein C1H46_018826 [Malus baccata]|uniref:Uncharacterized protein n=1 Tax=Malus baccata TaxID=106549 RepID=A0A540M9V0_MALBA|nr:hypothetical protein C1H46_018826 [Malus baccata]